ncbi:MAG: SNF2-related protein [Thermosynechococcaceae cyanobacterium MS004]|nr:SNF2-related protein [Thermosynechococcaceae cyanobacterium MS004]
MSTRTEISALKNRPWRINYASDTNNPIADFYIPALERSVQYDRKSGFFNSSILSRVASGLGAMLHNDGHIRLIMSCQFSPDDLQAIRQGYELREAIALRLDAELQPPTNFAQLKRLEILSWLIQSGRLDIRIAIPVKKNGQPENPEQTLDLNYIFHEKVCIFTDAEGQQIATNGSNNESGGGWENNVESFHVYCSWEGDRDLQRVQEEVSRFEQLWHNLMPNVRTFDVPEAVKRKLLRYAPRSKPTWSQETEQDTRSLPPEPEAPLQETETEPEEIEISPEQLAQEQEFFERLSRLHEDPGCLDFCLKTIPIQPWPHQIKILRRVAATFPCSFLIADEVGLGKTIETGLILRYLLVSKKVKRVLVLAPASVQSQWQEELREKFNLHFWSYGQNTLTDPFGVSVEPVGNPWNAQDLILASSHLVRRQERSKELLDSEPWDLIVVDEAHHARRKSPQNRKDTPNRLLQLLKQLRERTQSLILLSATPMQIDPIEVFDLLHVLGLEGYWSYGDAFCDYFASLSQKPDRHLLNFWQTMSSDYFARGGQNCPRLQQTLNQRDRMLAARVEDVWKGRQKIVSDRFYLQDKGFMEASRQFLMVNMPLKDLMFRHTRDTLRQYYRLGLLERDIPQRVVEDKAITLEPKREAELYRQVSNYVRHFYQLAQKENRKALGFLMTLYRKRLTSSFFAIQKSLERRLECLLSGQGALVTQDDLADLDDAEDAILDGLQEYMTPAHPEEIEYLQDLLRQFGSTGEDSKLSHFLQTLRQELAQRESAIVFTQYTDTMDFLREELRQLYGSQVACYSGRSGEILVDGEWSKVSKDLIKQRFKDSDIKILLCTESASEGLNLQTCGVLINYDMPWNPMRVEQRIGRIDRIGQRYPTVIIHNFYYDGTVEAKVYKKLRDRIQSFTTVVGKLQPILARVPTFIEQATMSVDPEEEDVLLSGFDQLLITPSRQPDLEDMVTMDIEADLAEISQPIVSSAFNLSDIEKMLTTSVLLKQKGFTWTLLKSKVWELTFESQKFEVTFDPKRFEENSLLRLMFPGESLWIKFIEFN